MKNITVGLWSKKSKEGKSYLQGGIELFGWNVAIFKNEKKEKENQPDYNMVISRSKPRETNSSEFIESDVDFSEIPF